MVVIGNVSHPDVVGDEHKINMPTNSVAPLQVPSDADGKIWLIVGTDSGFEGLTALYYTRISYSQTPTVATVTGTITYRERIALTPNAAVEIKLQDVSRADAPAVTMGEQIIENPGQVPIAFEIEYDPADIDDRFTYAIGVRITESAELTFINDTRYQIITRTARLTWTWSVACHLMLVTLCCLVGCYWYWQASVFFLSVLARKDCINPGRPDSSCSDMS